ncbi:MAG: hypothetical protein FH748_15795 [Balneolaceae bacterium]|nr:hypothetical protein [Balneolaceae bacterium]
MKNTIILFFLFFSFNGFAQDFTISWYRPYDASCAQDGYHTLRGYPGDSNGSFKSAGFNTLITYSQDLLQMYNGNTSNLDINDLISATNQYINTYPNQKFILDIVPKSYYSHFFSNSDVQQYISAFENNSQVKGWYIADEPEIQSAPHFDKSALISRYNYIKSISDKDVYVVFVNVKKFKAKFESTPGSESVAHFYDVLMVDSYPIQIGSNYYDMSETLWPVQKAIEIARNDQNFASDLVMFVAQGQGYNEDNNNCSFDYLNQDDFDQAQIRYMVMAPLIWGAKGMFFWSYANASKRGLPSDSWKVVHQFVNWFTAPDFHGNLGIILGTSPEPSDPTYENGIHYRTKIIDTSPFTKEAYILSSNNSNTTKTKTISVPSFANYEITSAVEKEFWYSTPHNIGDDPHSVINYSISSTWVGREIKVFKIAYTKNNCGDMPCPQKQFDQSTKQTNIPLGACRT